MRGSMQGWVYYFLLGSVSMGPDCCLHLITIFLRVVDRVVEGAPSWNSIVLLDEVGTYVGR